MEWYVYVGLAVSLGLILAAICIVVIRRMKRTSEINVDSIYDALGKTNVQAIDFRRNKINATLKNHKHADLDALKSAGAVGVNVVGNVAKFYFDTDNNEVYEALKQKIDTHG